MEFFTVKRERDALLAAKMQAMGNVLLASRLAAFALAPLCARIPCNRAAEAVASGDLSARVRERGSPEFRRLAGDDVALGDRVRVVGTAEEYQGQTQVSQVTSVEVCATGQTVAQAVN